MSGNAGFGLDGRLILTVIQFVCGTILAIDVAYELHANFVIEDPAHHYGGFHLAAEIIGTILLFLAFGLSARHLLDHRAALRQAEQKALSLRSDFSGLVERRFADWNLSPAEAEVTLLTLKGLRIAEIAALRKTCEGTIKAHLHAIFRKSGAKSRPERRLCTCRHLSDVVVIVHGKRSDPSRDYAALLHRRGSALVFRAYPLAEWSGLPSLRKL